MTKYKFILDNLQRQVDNGDLTLENAEIINELAFEKFSDEYLNCIYENEDEPSESENSEEPEESEEDRKYREGKKTLTKLGVAGVALAGSGAVAGSVLTKKAMEKVNQVKDEITKLDKIDRDANIKANRLSEEGLSDEAIEVLYSSISNYKKLLSRISSIKFLPKRKEINRRITKAIECDTMKIKMIKKRNEPDVLKKKRLFNKKEKVHAFNTANK